MISYSTSPSPKKIFKTLALVMLLMTFSKISPAQNYLYLYDYKASALHPQFDNFYFTKDSGRLYVKVFPSELLYKNNGSGFLAYCDIFMKVVPYIDAKEILDSTSISFSDEQTTQSDRFLVATLDYKTPQLTSYYLYVKVYDLNRKKYFDRYIKCSANDVQGNEAFFAKYADDRFPAFQNYFSQYDTVQIAVQQPNPGKCYVRYFGTEYPEALPPMSKGGFKKFSYIADKVTTVDMNTNTRLHFDKEGLYHFQYDSLQKTGYTICRFNNSYPRIIDPEQMIEPLRYVSTKDEFVKIQKADPKIAASNFWNEKAGSKENATRCMNEYYSRVQAANTYFTSYTEGWKTDRGMIWIVMGKPDAVYLEDKKERWVYSNNGIGNIEMVFEKIMNPFTDNDYALVRSLEYQQPWLIATDLWRLGSIFNPD